MMSLGISALLERWRGASARLPAWSGPAARDWLSTEQQGSASHALFRGLAESVIQPALSRLERRRFAAGSLVTPDRELHLVCAGRGQIVVTDAHGAERAVGDIGPGDTIGELALLTGRPHAVAVRSVSDLEVLVLPEDDFHRATAAFPQIYRNLGQMLAERLADSHLAARVHARHTALLLNVGAPGLVGYALACSLAWHTRAPVLLVVVGEHLPPDLRDLASRGPSAPGGARLLHVPTRTYEFTERQLRAIVETAGASGGHVLVHVEGDTAPMWRGERCVYLAEPGSARAHLVEDGLTIVAWDRTARWPRPDARGALLVPPLQTEDRTALATGFLGLGSASGRALGWAARDLAGLKVGLAFGAGCEKGYAHIGVWRMLNSFGLEADYVAGSSIGAAIGAMYAAGYTPDDAANLIDEISATAFRPTLPIWSILSGRRLEERVRRITRELKIEQLRLPLAIVTTDILTRRAVIHREGVLWRPLLGSMAIPGVFPAQRFGRHLLVDGSLVDPVPTRVVRAMGADIVIGVSLLGDDSSAPSDRAPALPRIIARAFSTMQDRLNAHATAGASIVIHAAAGTIGGSDLRRFQRGRHYIEPGECATQAALPQMIAALPWLAVA